MESISEVASGQICFSVKQAAELFGCSVRLLRSELALGKLGHFRVGRRVLISKEQLQAYIEKNSVQPSRAVDKACRIIKRTGLSA